MSKALTWINGRLYLLTYLAMLLLVGWLWWT